MREQWSHQSDDLLRWRQEMLAALAELDSGAPSVIFTHFLVINAVVGALSGRDETLVCWPDNASITTIGRGESGLVLQSLGRQMQTVVN
jgi:probable phosphoglycerate mutase